MNFDPVPLKIRSIRTLLLLLFLQLLRVDLLLGLLGLGGGLFIRDDLSLLSASLLGLAGGGLLLLRRCLGGG
jgi:hypothetical protein